MEKIVERTLLYDFYGTLLTEHQQKIYEDVVLNDFSFSEIAAERGITRQGVHDNIKRCHKILQGYEDKLHLVEKFMHIKTKIHRIHQLTGDSKSMDKEEFAATIESISNEILEEL